MEVRSSLLSDAVAQLALRALRIALYVTAAAALAGLIATLAALPTAPWRVSEGVAIAAAAWLGARSPEVAAAILRKRTGLGATIVLLGLLIAFDGAGESPYLPIGYAATAVAVVVASPATVALSSAFIVAAWSAGELVDGHGLAFLYGGGLGRLLNEVADVTVPAVLLLCALAAGKRTLREAPDVLDAARRGGVPAPTALLVAIRRGSRAMLPRGDAVGIVARLSPAEMRVVELLAGGLLAKQIALELSVSLATVRSHIAAAKRKTDAATVAQLAGLWAEAQPGD
jgi:DNA-binding CsgD family transcriptional regulator